MAASPSSVHQDMPQKSLATTALSSFHQSVQESSILNVSTLTAISLVPAAAQSTIHISYQASSHQLTSAPSLLMKATQIISWFSPTMPTVMDGVIKSTASSAVPAVSTSSKCHFFSLTLLLSIIIAVQCYIIKALW